MRGRLSGHHERRQTFPADCQKFIGVEENAEILSRFKRSAGTARSHRLRAASPVAPTAGAPGGHNDDAIGRNLEQALDLIGGEPRNDDDPIGAMRVIACQRGVIAANLCACALRMSQKIQIVDRHDARGAPRRHQQRMERMGHVDGSGDERFDWRPFESMPGEIQHAYWNPAIDDRRRGEIVAAMQTIFPRAREQRQVECRPRMTRPAFNNARGELVCIFANTTALAERWTVVEEDAHLCKSFRVSILL